MIQLGGVGVAVAVPGGVRVGATVREAPAISVSFGVRVGAGVFDGARVRVANASAVSVWAA